MSEKGAVRQADLLGNFPPGERKRIRDKLLKDTDWYKVGPTIWIRQAGIERLAIAEVDMSVAQKFVNLVVIDGCPNKSWVVCRKPGEGGKRLCMIPRRLKARQLIGKPIRAEEVTDAQGNTTYQHESLAV